ncbi:MAG TPA: 50S ribosomal protein L7/L12, partial [Patescibacteria group bacterium]|nr:50S ribosomal protein L7/L12 [Patescibacteria group bacterium]
MSDVNSAEILEKNKEVVAALEKLSVIEMSQLVKALEEKWGVSASAPVVAAAGGAAVAAEEKTSFNVELTEAGANKIGV